MLTSPLHLRPFEAGVSGGAFYSIRSDVTLHHVNLRENNSTHAGAGLLVEESSTIVADCHFANNSIDLDSGVGGHL